MIMPVLNERALYDETLKMLIIADLHIGIEQEFEHMGIIIPDQIENMKTRISALLEQYSVSTLYILGDVKHNIYATDYHQTIKLVQFFEFLHTRVNTVIIPGNHDGMLKKLIPQLKIVSSKGTLVSNYYLTHGHTWPAKSLEKARFLIMGHIHPELKLEDKQGSAKVVPCWIRGKPEKKLKQYYNFDGEIIIMPSFNIVTGRIINHEKVILGPLLYNSLINLNHMDVYLLNGTNLGKIIKPQ